MPQTYSVFSAYPGPSYGTNYPPYGILPGRYGVGLWRPGYVAPGMFMARRTTIPTRSSTERFPFLMDKLLRTARFRRRRLASMPLRLDQALSTDGRTRTMVVPLLARVRQSIPQPQVADVPATVRRLILASRLRERVAPRRHDRGGSWQPRCPWH